MNTEKVEETLKKMLPTMADLADKWFDSLPIEDQLKFYKEAAEEMDVKNRLARKKISELEAKIKDLEYALNKGIAR